MLAGITLALGLVAVGGIGAVYWGCIYAYGRHAGDPILRAIVMLHDDCRASDFLARVDAALYRAEEAGRNRGVSAHWTPGAESA